MKPHFTEEQLAYLKDAVDYLQKKFGDEELTAELDENMQRGVAFQDAQLMLREVFNGLYK